MNPFLINRFIKLRRTRTDGPTVRFHCESCCVQNVEAASEYVTEYVHLLSYRLPPVLTRRFVFLKCNNCRKTTLLRAPTVELTTLTPTELEELVLHRSAASLVFSALSVLFCWIPLVGLLFPAIALCLSLKGGRGEKLLAIGALLLVGMLQSVVFQGIRQKEARCLVLQSDLQTQLKARNFCSEDQDCYLPQLNTELGCISPINRRELSAFVKDYAPYAKDCVAQRNFCVPTTSAVSCALGKCVVK